MTISSMTGYAVASHDGESGTVTIELRSVNSRFLDLQFRINDELRAFEPALRDAIAQSVARGKVECRLSYGRKTRAEGLAVNAELIGRLQTLQTQVKQTFPDAAALSVAELLRWPGMLEEGGVSQEVLGNEIMIALREALQQFAVSRQREGAALKTMLVDRIEKMEEIVARITPLVPQAIAQFQQKASERMQEALAKVTTPQLHDEAMERIRQEVTLYGVRMDVAEELTRLSTHLAETRVILNKGGPLGKRLDFMMQELNREANTVGSKAALKELSDAAMALKLLIEQMREQVQNLE